METSIAVGPDQEPKKPMPKDGDYCALCGHCASAHLRYGVHECGYNRCQLCTSVGWRAQVAA